MAFVKWNRRRFFVGAGFRRRGGSRTAPTSTSAYLDLAVTESLPLATLDKNMRAAAKRAGVELLKVSAVPLQLEQAQLVTGLSIQ